ncbi:hypothetical protein [Nocardioides sp. WS12]|uniref:hypothetical protein n=1 Tax=Nocardioides sp. WS12 TaxID=2486272 RepID=UPI0015F88175|nr:hypothetical protein [Nocardioides sp. WS12]
MSSREDILRAASHALIDMRTPDGEWEAVETDISSGNVVVTLRKESEELTCVCKDPNSDEVDESCELCLFGMQPDDEYVEVIFAVVVTS